MAIINKSVITDEVTTQKEFYKLFYGTDWENTVSLDRNTDGYTKDIFYEHKTNAQHYGIYKALSQAIIYLTKFNMEGVPIPAKICIVGQEDKKAYIYNTEDYMNYIEDIERYASLSPSKGIEGFVEKNSPTIINFDINHLANSSELYDFIRSTKGQVKVHITKDNVWGWSKYYYNNAEKNEKKKDKFFEELKNPISVLKDLIYPWTGDRKDFALIMDLLNDPATQKKLGCYYSPLPYCEKAVELVRQAISRVPEGNDYVIIDRCAGTGNLEYALSEEELTHVIINTYELQEWIALKNRMGSLVRHIIPPIPQNKNELPEKNVHGFLSGANALSKSFIERPEIKQYIDNPKCTIILFENPPYRDSSSSDKETVSNDNEEVMNTNSYVYEEMSKHLKEFNNSNTSTARDVVNQFIWSGFEYYLRQPTDSYILLSPVKCYKSLGMLDYKFGGGFLFNREHFHASAASIMCTLWFNEKDETEKITLEAYDINKNENLEFVKNIDIRKVYNTFEPYFDRRKFEDDFETEVYCETDGTETTGRKCEGKSYFNNNSKDGHSIIAYCRTVAYPIAAMNRYFTRQALYGARGFYIREDNFLEKLPLFVAKMYPLKNWYDKEVLMTSSDGGYEYIKDESFLKSCLIFTCLSRGNKCISFDGSDGNYYRNELCFDGDTLASKALSNMNLTDAERELIELYNNVLNEIKRKNIDGSYKYDEYNPKFSYGIHQISLHIDIIIPKTDSSGNIVYKGGDKNGDSKPLMEKKYGKNLYNIIKPLQKALDNYYLEFIAPKMFEYQLIK